MKNETHPNVYVRLDLVRLQGFYTGGARRKNNK